MGHSILSPSGADGWMVCAAQPMMCKARVREESSYAAEGTLAHELAAEALLRGCDAIELSKVTSRGVSEFKNIPEDMYEPVQIYIDTVRAMSEGAEEIGYECVLDTSDVMGVPEQMGTADVCAVVPAEGGYELQIHDLKYGKGVRVSAEGNRQLMIYGLAALNQYDLAYNIVKVRLVIHQVRLGNTSEWVCSVEELKEFGQEVKTAAARCMKLYSGEIEPGDEDFAPGAKTCRWCEAKADCEPLSKTIEEGVKGDFEKIEEVSDALPDMGNKELSRRLNLLELLKMYTKALEKTALARALGGQQIPGYKVVEGRKGNRMWESEEAAERLLKSMRVQSKVMYKKVLQTPTFMQKMLRTQPKRLRKLEGIITRKNAVKHLVPVSDSRPAVDVGVKKDFELEE